MSSRRNDPNYQYRKAAARHAFSVIPKYFLKNNKKIGEKNIMVPRLQSKQKYFRENFAMQSNLML
jgi:hypothetical protein